MRSASILDLPFRVVSSRQSAPKFEIRKSPFLANARPFGSVPSRYRDASVLAGPIMNVASWRSSASASGVGC